MSEIRNLEGEFKVQLPSGKWTTRYFGANTGWLPNAFPYELESAKTRQNAPIRFTKTRAEVVVDEGPDSTPVTEKWAIRNLTFYREQNPLTRVKINSPSQLTGLDPSERLKRRRRKTAKQPMRGVYANPLVRVTVAADSQRPRRTKNAKGRATTTLAPSRRLMSRRRKTDAAPKGFYANPSDVVGFPYRVESQNSGYKGWLPRGSFKTTADAKQYAHAYAKLHPDKAVRVVSSKVAPFSIDK